MPGKWIDFSLGGHQIVCHFVGSTYKAIDYHNPVDKDEVPGKCSTLFRMTYTFQALLMFVLLTQCRTSGYVWT
jgi:extradiol dioxygenase family protein